MLLKYNQLFLNIPSRWLLFIFNTHISQANLYQGFHYKSAEMPSWVIHGWQYIYNTNL
jgi:hypothetical protein